MSSVAEGDCSADQVKQKLPTEVWVLITANVVIALGYGVVSPVLPQYARDFGVSISAATFVITAFSLMRLVFAPASGLFVQKMGERRVYLSGLLIVAVSTGACAFAQTYWQLLLFRSLGGFGSAMFTVSSLGLMIRISPPDARGRVAGLFSSAFLVGSVGGPVLGSLTAGLGLAAPFAIYGVALLVAAAVVFLNLRHSSLASPEEETEAPVTLRMRCVTRRIRRRCSPISRRDGRCSACVSPSCRCSSPRCCIADHASRVSRWRRSRSATWPRSSPAAISRTASAAARC